MAEAIVVRHSTAKKSLKGEDFAISVLDCKWPQDSSTFIQFGYHAIFDGHGGQAAALQCKKTLLGEIIDALDTHAADEIDETDNLMDLFLRCIGGAMVDAFEAVNREVFSIDDSGSTATVVLHCVQPQCEVMEGHDPDLYLVCANVGDSHAYFYSGVNTTRLNCDHRLDSNKSECERVKAAGGTVDNKETKTEMGPMRLYPGGLMMSRTIGDSAAPQAIAEPEVRIAYLPPCGGRVTIASDGLWDIATGKQASKLVHTKAPQPAAQSLVVNAQKKNSRDDITVIVVDILPWSRRNEKLPWSLPNGQSANNLTLPESGDSLVMYDGLKDDGAVSPLVKQLRQSRVEKLKQIRSVTTMRKAMAVSEKKEKAAAVAAAASSEASFDNFEYDLRESLDGSIKSDDKSEDEWTLKPKKVSKKVEATLNMSDNATDLFLDVLVSDAVNVLLEESAAKAKKEFKQKQKEKKLLKQKKLREEKEAQEKKQKAAQKLQADPEAESQRKNGVAVDSLEHIKRAGLVYEVNLEEQEKLLLQFEKQRKQQEREAAEKAAALAARNALGGASHAMRQQEREAAEKAAALAARNALGGASQAMRQKQRQEQEQDGEGFKTKGKTKTKAKNKNHESMPQSQNDAKISLGSTNRFERMNGLNKSELSQVKNMSKVDPVDMISASDLEADVFTSLGWGELAENSKPFYPPPATTASAVSMTGARSGLSTALPPGLDFGNSAVSPSAQATNSVFAPRPVSPNRLAVSYGSDSRIISMSPLMKPLKNPANLTHDITDAFGSAATAATSAGGGDDRSGQNKRSRKGKKVKDKSSTTQSQISEELKKSQSSPRDPNEGKVLHVSRYAKGTTKDMFSDLFSKHGEVTKVVLKEHFNNSYCFVSFSSKESADEARLHLQGSLALGTEPLKVNYAAHKDSMKPPTTPTSPCSNPKAAGGGGGAPVESSNASPRNKGKGGQNKAKK